MRSDLVDLLLFEHHRTAAAILVSDTGEQKDAVWLPLSQYKDGGKFIPHYATFLNRGGWEGFL